MSGTNRASLVDEQIAKAEEFLRDHPDALWIANEEIAAAGRRVGLPVRTVKSCPPDRLYLLNKPRFALQLAPEPSFTVSFDSAYCIRNIGVDVPLPLVDVGKLIARKTVNSEVGLVDEEEGP